MESVVTPGGHEIDFDRLLVEELTALGHTVEFYVPDKHEFKWNYGVPVHHVPGEGISYKGAKGLKKMWLALRRELHRRMWYRYMYKYACQDKFDVIIFPSATYRYLNGLKHSDLKKSPVPVLFLIHGATPDEAHRLTKAAKPYNRLPNIRVGIQTFAARKLKVAIPHAVLYAPPNYIPRDIVQSDYENKEDVLKLGFFGQYRKEKNVEAFIQAFLKGNYQRPVKLIVQGSTMTDYDAEDFQRIIDKYKGEKSIEFWHRAIIGDEWQKGLTSVDAIVIPYGNDRYLYHTSALISNAMGYRRPVISADNVNPEILANYNIGMSFKNGHMEDLQATIEKFVNNYDSNKDIYAEELERAYNDFSPRKLAEHIVTLAQMDFTKY